MHLACTEPRSTVLLTGNTLRSNVRTRGLGGFDLGLERGKLVLKGRELLLQGLVLREELGVLGDKGKDLHCWWMLVFVIVGVHLGAKNTKSMPPTTVTIPPNIIICFLKGDPLGVIIYIAYNTPNTAI